MATYSVNQVYRGQFACKHQASSQPCEPPIRVLRHGVVAPCRSLLLKQQLYLRADLPVRSLVRPCNVVIPCELQVHRMSIQVDYLAKTAPQRDGLAR
jgi:hypothetical protein